MLVFCSPLYWYNFSGHIKNAMDRLFPYSQKNKPRDLKIKEVMLLVCGESWFKKSFAGPAESYRQMPGYKGWKDRGRIFVAGVYDHGEIAGDSSLKTAEQMSREAYNGIFQTTLSILYEDRHANLQRIGKAASTGRVWTRRADGSRIFQITY